MMNEISILIRLWFVECLECLEKYRLESLDIFFFLFFFYTWARFKVDLNQKNSFCMNGDTAVKGIHFVWILTQHSKEFIWCEYWHQKNSLYMNIDTTVKEIQHAGGTFCTLFTLSCHLAYSLYFPFKGIALSMVNKLLQNWSKSNIFRYFWFCYNCIYWFESSVYLGWIPWDGLDIIWYHGE